MALKIIASTCTGCSACEPECPNTAIREKKDDPAEVARLGFEAMMRGDEQDSVSGWRSKLQSALANVMPAGTIAKPPRKLAAPGLVRR